MISTTNPRLWELNNNLTLILCLSLSLYGMKRNNEFHFLLLRLYL
jgi:hypothetical protein